MRKKFIAPSAARVLAACALGCVAPAAHAYVDPGTGSLLVQGLIGAIAVAAFTLRHYWYRLKSFLKFGKRNAGTPAERERGAAQRDD